MIEKLCELYGSQTELEMEKEKCTFFDFPSISQMGRNLNGMEKQLRDAGFGYRAASIAKTVKMLTDKEWTAQNGDAEEWLDRLRAKPYQEAKVWGWGNPYN
jgi:3-methyladenine DNA glycosylase/8-oxoguanine DNA glycosylase